MNNISALRRNQVPQMNPVQAYQRSLMANEQLLQQKQQQQRREEWLQKEQAWREQQAGAAEDRFNRTYGIQLFNAMKTDPSAAMEKANLLASTFGYENADSAMNDPKYVEALQQQLTSGGVNVNLGQEGTSWEDALVKRSISDYSTLMDAASSSGESMNRLRTMAALNEQIDSGGTLGGAVDSVKANLEGLGIDLPGINETTTPRQLYEALATQNTFERTRLLKGAISERELDLAGRIDGSLANTQPGRRAILQYRLMEQQRIADLGEAAEAYRVRAEGEGKNYRESDFRKSPEYQRLRNMPFMTRDLFEALRDTNESDQGKRKFGDYIMVNGQWWMRNPEDPDGDVIPVRFYGE
jgi:hypothetical protein